MDLRVEHTFGHHPDPFHSVDTYYVSDEVGGSADCTIRRGATIVSFSDMHFYLIRRACVFEGNVRHRLRPKALCEALGLA
jgi:hypothetical protein